MTIERIVLPAFVLLAATGNAQSSQPAAHRVTFAKDVAPIFQEKCETCHRAGQGAPMNLQTYEEVRPWARAIKERVATRNMPPWHLDKTIGIQHYANDRSLSEKQIKTVVEWVDAGAPLGDKRDLPAPKVWPDDSAWQYAQILGQQPDIVVTSEPLTIPAIGQDQWWKPLSDVPVTEERWIRAVEMRPATVAGRRVTHHAVTKLVQYEPTSNAGDDGSDPGLLMEWSIGKSYDAFRPDTGKLLLPGAKIRWDIHYHSVGEQITDHLELAIYLYPKGHMPEHRTRLSSPLAMVAKDELDIRPNTIAPTQGFTMLRSAARIENFQPHMHLRGKAMAMQAILPDGTVEMLSYVDRFDFNWMINYIYADASAPVVPKGTVLRVTAWYDNTRANKYNPDPNQWVGYGDRTIEEMGEAFVNITNISDQEYADWLAKHKMEAQTARIASPDNAQFKFKQVPVERPHDSGQTVTPAFEGWWQNSDGTYNLLFGYLNRNRKEVLDIPIGPNNHMGPGLPDQGQPTHFLPRRQKGVFTVTVPKDFGDQQLTWTIVSNGHTLSVPGHLGAAWIINPMSEIGIGNTPPTISFDEKGPSVQGPRPVVVERTAKAGEPLSLDVFAADDDKSLGIIVLRVVLEVALDSHKDQPGAASLAAAVRAAGPGGDAVATPQLLEAAAAAGMDADTISLFKGGPSVTLTWQKYRGPGEVIFSESKPRVDEVAGSEAPIKGAFNGKGTTTATFSEPGEYILRVVANDSSGPGGGDFICCWTNGEVKVKVE
jgi:hypothetical protein